MGKNKHRKSKWHLNTIQGNDNSNRCGCYYCTGNSVEEYQNKKYCINTKHKNKDLTNL